MAYLPKKGSLRERICLKFLECPMNMEDIAQIFKGERYNAVTAAVCQLKYYGAITQEGRIYSLADHVKRHFGLDVPVKEEAAPISTTQIQTAIWKPLSIKNMAWRNPLIADRLTGQSFITCTSVVPFSGEWQ